MSFFNKKTEVKKQPAVEVAKVNDGTIAEGHIRSKFPNFGKFLSKIFLSISQYCLKIVKIYTRKSRRQQSLNDAKSASKTETEVKSMKDLYGTAEAGTAKSAVKRGEKRSVNGAAYKIIVKPLVTEKVSGLAVLNKYVFAVAKNVNKIEVAKAIKEIYGVKPVGVNVIRMSGKKARYGRISGQRKDWKKAIITLPQGETIKIYEGV